MFSSKSIDISKKFTSSQQAYLGLVIAGLMLTLSFLDASAQSYNIYNTDDFGELPDSIPVALPAQNGETNVDAVESSLPNLDVVEDRIEQSPAGKLLFIPIDTISVFNAWEPRPVEFNPDPTRAVWMSALFPGLGQIYNRRYWKLPIVVGGYLGLGYATSWNNRMLGDYTQAYRDIMDDDPSTNSYMDLFPPTVEESSLDKGWLQNVLKSRKDYFRRNRDLCIICMVGVYFLAMVDAYVDASLSHFDISESLSMDVAPAIMQDGRNRYPSVGLVWALNF